MEDSPDVFPPAPALRATLLRPFVSALLAHHRAQLGSYRRAVPALPELVDGVASAVEHEQREPRIRPLNDSVHGLAPGDELLQLAHYGDEVGLAVLRVLPAQVDVSVANVAPL